MKKTSSCSSHNLCSSFPSPGAPNYRGNRGSRDGWSSDRIPEAAIRRHAVAGFTPLGAAGGCGGGGRTVPSKWDEAERWICSPVSASAHSDGRASRSRQLQRRPKSISGPIVAPPLQQQLAYYCSPAGFPLRQGLVVRNLMVGSPFSTGVLAPVAVSVHHYDDDDDDDDDYDHGVEYSCYGPLAVQCASVLSGAEQPCDPSSFVSQDEKHDGIKNEDTEAHSRCDRGTQMSTSGSENDAHPSSSPESCSSTSVKVQLDCQSPKLVVRDVEVDSQARFIRGSKRDAIKLTKTESLGGGGDLRESSSHAPSSSWDVQDSTSDVSKLQREEAKIIAWENLQKAKAEAAIRKLEMKLEKKRSSSMDKILNKLRKAQLKAESMRSSTIPVEQDHRVSKTCNVFSFHKYAQIWSQISCFRSHAQ